MKIDLKQLRGTASACIPFSETPDLREETLYGAKPFRHEVQASGKVTNDLGVLRLQGTIQTTYSTTCARCLKTLQIPLRADVSMILTNDPDAEEDTHLYVLQGDCVDTTEIMVSALLLEVQMTYLCRPDCRGICPHCGADRNITDCDCESKQRDPRFSALYSLLEDNRQHGE